MYTEHADARTLPQIADAIYLLFLPKGEKNMKKIVSMCAAFAMLLTVLCAVPAQAANSHTAPYVYVDFEDGTATGVGTGTGSAESTAQLSVVDGGFGGSAKALQVLTANSGSDFTINTNGPASPAGCPIKVSMWVKPINGKPFTIGTLFNFAQGGHYTQASFPDVAAGSDWTQVSTTLDRLGTDTTGALRLLLRFDAESEFLVDDIIVEPATTNAGNDGVKTVFYEDFNGSSVSSNMQHFTSMFTASTTNDSKDGTGYYKSALGDYGDGGCGFIVMKNINFEYGHTYEISYDYRIDSRNSDGATVLNTWKPQNKLYVLHHNATAATNGQWYTYRSQFSLEGKTEQDILKSYNGGDIWGRDDKGEIWYNQLKFGAPTEGNGGEGQKNAAISLDNFKIVDLGIVSNGDMETTAGNGNVRLTDTADGAWGNESQTFPGWRRLNGVSLTATDDVRPGSTGTRAMQVDLQGVTEGVYESPYQTVNLGANGSSKKLSFWAKAFSGNPSNGKPIIMVLDRSGATKTVYDVPDYQYYTGGQCYKTLEEAQAAENKWIIWDAYWTHFTCDLDNTFDVIGTETDGTVPSSAYMYFIAGNNAAWTLYKLDDVEILDGSIPAVSDITVTGDFEVGKQVTVNWTYAGPGEDVSFARIIGTVDGKDVSLGTVSKGGTYTVPMAAAGKTLRVEILPMSSTGVTGKTATKAVELTGTFGTISVDPEWYDATIMYSEDAADVTVIWAVYDGNELVEMVVNEDPVNLTAMEEVEVWCPGLSKDGEVVVMVWENFTSVKPLMGSCTVGQ